MFASERRDAILRELHLLGSVRVSSLSQRLGASEITIRRDLADLAQQGLLDRVHGGARAVSQGHQPAAALDPARAPQRATSGGSGDGNSRRARQGEAITRAPDGPARQSDGGPVPPTAPGTLGPGPGAGPVAVMGLLLPSATYYFPAVIRGAEDAARALNVRLILAISEYDAHQERRQIERLIGVGVDGILATPTHTESADPQTYRVLSGLHVPVVLMERVSDPTLVARPMEYVRTDHAYGGSLAVRHLAAQGHRRIGLLLNSRSATAPWIREGYVSAVSELGLDEDAPYERVDPGRPDPEVLRKLLDSCVRQGATAVLVHADSEAVLFAQIAKDQGIDVPRDLAIVAYDDEIAGLADPPLTAIAPPKQDVGSTAVKMCLSRISDPSGRGGHAIQRTTLLPELVVRDSA